MKRFLPLALLLALTLVGAQADASRLLTLFGSGSQPQGEFTYADDAHTLRVYTDDAHTQKLITEGEGPIRAVASNRNMLPATTTASSNFVRHSRLMFKVPTNASYSHFQVTYLGWGANSASEFNAPDNVNLKASIECGASVYALTWNGGQTSTGLPVAQNVTSDSQASLTAAPGSTCYIITRTHGAPGSLSRIIGQGTHVISGEGIVFGTDGSIDLTTGSYAKGAVAGPATVNGSGNITAVSMVGGSPGTGYSAGVSVYAFEIQPDGTIAQKTIGNTNNSGGGVASITITSGTPPSGVAAWVSPTIVIGNAFSATSQVYGPALITAIPSVTVKSLAIWGDSIAIGFGSTDAIGDLNRNFGVYERALNNIAGVVNVSAPGATAANYQSLTVYPKLHAFIQGKTTHAILPLGTNDVQGGGTKTGVENNLNTLATFLRNGGAEVGHAKFFPRDSSSDGFATVVNQTPATGFTLGGVGDQIDADRQSGALVSDFGVIDLGTFFRDTTTTTAWAVTSPLRTTDGIHSNAVGNAAAGNDSGHQSQFNFLQ